VWALEDSVLQTGNLQCVGLVRAYTMLEETPLPRLGSGPDSVGVPLQGFEWHGSEDIQEGLYEVEPGDILFYRRTTETNHWAVVSEVTPEGAVLVEAVGSRFRWGEIEAAAGGVLVGQRVFDFAAGSATGTPSKSIVGWGVYRIEP